MMRIDLTTPEGEHVVLALNGTVAAEVCVGQARTRDDLEREVEQARVALTTVRGIIPSLCEAASACDRPSGDGKTADAWARGLRDGLAGRRAPHPYGSTIPPIMREHSHPYRDGYGYGDALRRVAGLATADAPPDLFDGLAHRASTETVRGGA